jgi:hypothetical protein
MYTALTGLGLDDALDVVEEEERGIEFGPAKLKALQTINDHIGAKSTPADTTGAREPSELAGHEWVSNGGKEQRP